MSTPSQNAGCSKNVLYLGGLLLGAWLAWKVLRVLYDSLSIFSLKLFSHLDGTYGQIGGWPGYALLGLGLGAAAGAVAVQHRFRLSKWMLAGAGVLTLAMVGGMLLSTPEPSTEMSVPDPEPISELETVAPTIEPAPEAPAVPKALVISSDYHSEQPDRKLLQDVHDYLMRNNEVGAPDSYTDFEVWVQDDAILQNVQNFLSRQSDVELPTRFEDFKAAVLAGVPPLPTAETESTADAYPDTAIDEAPPAAPIHKTPKAPKAPRPVAGPSEPVAATPATPTGHHEYHGQIGQRDATYSVDWQDNGELSGSYYFDEYPNTLYRLTGAIAKSGELRLLELTRGRQSARCILQRQGESYTGTRHSLDGQELPMSINQP